MIPVHSDFDSLLGGGLQPRNITHVYGAPASGKTNIALMAVANATKIGKVIFIDSEGSFSTERLKQIAGERINEVMKNIIIIEPTDFDEQKVAINRLSEIVPSTAASLVVVDSIAVLYRLEEDKDVKELGRQMAKLLRIGRKYNIPILVTNQIYTDIDTGRNVPVGGDVIRYWAKISIEIEKRENMRTAILRKHKFLPEGIRMSFRINDKGMDTLSIDVPAQENIPSQNRN